MLHQQQSLPGDWTLQLHHVPDGVAVPDAVAESSVPATVPGCVHTDLLAAGLIPDPYLDENEPKTHWIGYCDWRYETSFELPKAFLASDRTELVFDGLDTIAEVAVNGMMVGRAENMHVRYRFDIREAAVEGTNHLRIIFHSPRRYAETMNERMGDRPKIGAGSNVQLPHQMMRKMACNFGWDWGPQLLTCGIWRSARLEAWSQARLGDVRPLIRELSDNLGLLEVRADVAWASQSAGAGWLHAQMIAPDGELVVETTGRVDDVPAKLDLQVSQPQRWWPVGYGDQPLYKLRLQLLDDGGRLLDRRSQKIGLRTVQLCTDPDPVPVEGMGQGATFHLKVNGRRIFCKGASWIPDDCFPHRITAEQYQQRIDQAVDANMNMLRVWGGGIYEDHVFYEYCDRVGMLVWQDFLLACACYPEEEPFWSWFEAEAQDNVARLSRHPSLVLWNGCNENIWGTFDWSQSWQNIRKDGTQSWGQNYYLKLLPQVVEEVDPSRPFWPGSPYSGSMQIHPNANEYGNRHIWDVWNGEGDYRNYLGHFPRFASEFGFQAPCTWQTLHRAIPAEKRQWLSPAMQLHNKQSNGQQRALDRLEADFDLPEDFEALWYLTSINQCRALTFGCEWFRALSPWCSGALYWQFNDCWPASSWAAIDGDGHPKPLWHATRRFFRPRLITILPAQVTPRDQPLGQMAVYLHNDTDCPWREKLTLRHIHVNGQEHARQIRTVEVPPRDCRRFLLPSTWANHCGDVILVETDHDRAWWFYGRDRHIPYLQPELQLRLEHGNKGYRGTLTTSTLVRDLCLVAPNLPQARIEPQCITMLADESATFHITADATVTLETLQTSLAVHCANQYGGTAVQEQNLVTS